MSGSEPRQYRVLDVIGRGGFGTVYRAELRLAGGFAKDVALKVLNPSAEGNPVHLARLRDEARLLGLVRHRALVGVDGLVKLFDRWTVVMEYVDGVSLLELLDATDRVPIAVALQIVEEVASGLHAAYTASDRDGNPLKLLHRDVKPSNVQLTRHGEVKLLDFGVARAEFKEREATSGSLVYGSLPYLAPERLDLEDSHTADVYSLVVMLTQLVTGHKPTHPTADPARHAERIDEVCAAVGEVGGPPELLALVRRGLAWEPTARPDARELERLCRTVRTSLPDVHLGDWAAGHVDAVQAARQVERGEFTGMLASEAQTTERHRQLAELLGVAIPTTFDDPVTTEAEVTAEVPPPEPPTPSGPTTTPPPTATPTTTTTGSTPTPGPTPIPGSTPAGLTPTPTPTPTPMAPTAMGPTPTPAGFPISGPTSPGASPAGSSGAAPAGHASPGSSAAATTGGAATGGATNPGPWTPSPSTTTAPSASGSRPARRRRWPLFLLSALSAVGLAGLVVFAAGSSALLGVTALVLSADDSDACATVVRTTRQELTDQGVAGVDEAADLFDASLDQCRDGSLGMWSGTLLMAQFRRLAKDGQLSDLDRQELRLRVRESARR